MSALKNKLRAHRGETLAEVLVSLLILGLSTLMLASMLNTAGQLGVQAQKRDEEFLAALNSVEGRESLPGVENTGKKVIISEVGKEDVEIDVNLYGNDRLRGYALKELTVTPEITDPPTETTETDASVDVEVAADETA